MRLFEVVDEGAGRADGEGEGLHAESLQGLHPQLRTQFFGGGIIHERPFLKGGDIVVAEALLHALDAIPLHHQFLGGEGCEERGDIVQRALRDLEGAGGSIQEGGAGEVVVEGEAAEEVMFLLLQHPLAEGDARGENLRDTALHQLRRREFRIFQLVADGNLVAGANQFGQVLRQRMMRDAGHGRIPFVAVGLAREHYPQHLAGDEGVVAVGLVEIPHAEQQHRLRILSLDAEILLEQRGIFGGLCHIKAKIRKL